MLCLETNRSHPIHANILLAFPNCSSPYPYSTCVLTIWDARLTFEGRCHHYIVAFRQPWLVWINEIEYSPQATGLSPSNKYISIHDFRNSTLPQYVNMPKLMVPTERTHSYFSRYYQRNKMFYLFFAEWNALIKRNDLDETQIHSNSYNFMLCGNVIDKNKLSSERMFLKRSSNMWIQEHGSSAMTFVSFILRSKNTNSWVRAGLCM